MPSRKASLIREVDMIGRSLIFCLCVMPALAGASRIEAQLACELEEVLPSVTSAHLDERLAAREDLGSCLTTLVEELIVIAETDKAEYHTHDSREIAFRILGRLGTTRALPVMIEHVDFTYSGMRFLSDRSPLNRYPAALALVDVGEVAVPAITEYLRREGTASEEKISIFSDIVLAIFAGERSEALETVNRLSSGSKSAAIEKLVAELASAERSAQ